MAANLYLGNYLIGRLAVKTWPGIFSAWTWRVVCSNK